MKFEQLLEETSDRLHVKPTDPSKLVVVDDLGAFVAEFDSRCENQATRAVHSYNVLPRLLRAVEAERDAHAAFIGGADNSVGRWSSALTELRLAIAAAKDIPDA